AAQATELSALVPIAHCRAERLVLVGDHCQLPASTLSLEAENRGLTLSLFGRLVAQGLPPCFLDTQFRMHPAIAAHSSASFYGGRLQSGVPAEARLPPQGFPWPNPSAGGVALLPSRGLTPERRDGESWCNLEEADALIDILKGVLGDGHLKPSE
ncbi:unnamed protein product, partial [Polarella glacialis]